METTGKGREIGARADVLFTNGRVITVDAEDTICDTVAVKRNRILRCGARAEVEDLIGPETEVIDLRGRTLMPGFIDSHMHFQVMGMLLGPIVDVSHRHAGSIREIQDLIRRRAARKKPGEWIVSSGYDNNKLEEKRHPTLRELDEAAPHNPVRVGRCDGHMGVCNSLALRICGIEKETGPSDEVIRENGELTGLLKEASFFRVARYFRFTEEEILGGLAACNDLLLGYGITTVHDAGLEGPSGMRFIETASRNGTIKVRLHVMVSDLSSLPENRRLLESFIRTGLTTGFGNERFSIGPIKVITDGSSSGPTCVMKEPFSHDPSLKGFQLCSPDEAREILERAHMAGYQITAHAQGDLSIEFMLDIIGDITRAHPRGGCRPRLEHAGMMTPETVGRMRELGVVPTPNPGFIGVYGSDYLRYYGKRTEYMYPLKEYLDAGIPAAIGSDAPVTDCNPMHALHAAVTRKDRRTGETVGAAQGVRLLDAIRMYTYNGAYASNEEGKKGSIEPGKLADLVVLSRDILTAPMEELPDITADLTMIDGEIVYRRRM